MHFGYALRALKSGARCTRKGWHGAGMFVFLVAGSRFQVNRPPLLGIYPEGTTIDYHPHIDLRTAEGLIVPWVASQSDLLAEDWELAEAGDIRHDDEDDERADPRRSSMARVAADRAQTLTCAKNADGMHRFTEHDGETDQWHCACGLGSRERTA